MSNDDVMSRGRYREERQDSQGVDAATVQTSSHAHKLHLSALLTMFPVTAASSAFAQNAGAAAGAGGVAPGMGGACRRSAPQRPIRDRPASRRRRAAHRPRAPAPPAWAPARRRASARALASPSRACQTPRRPERSAPVPRQAGCRATIPPIPDSPQNRAVTEAVSKLAAIKSPSICLGTGSATRS